MNEAQIRHLLTAIQVDVSKHSYSGSQDRTRWLNIRCPFAPWRHQGGRDETPSFGLTINEDGRRSVYKCFSCQSKGRVAHLPSQLGHLRKRDYEKYRKWAELAELQASTSRPVPTWEDNNADTNTRAVGTNERVDRPVSVGATGYGTAIGHHYLRQRGINWQTTYLCDLRYDAFQKRILFPVYDRYESFVGFTGRSTRKGNKSTKGNNPKVRDYFGLPKREVFLRLRSGERRGKRIIVEGLFDFANLVQQGYRNAHAILGTSPTPEKVDYLIDEGEAVFFLMDNDLAGWQALFGTRDGDGNFTSQDCWTSYLFTEIPTWIVPWNSLFDGSDPGQLSNAQIEKMLAKAWLYTGKKPLDALGEPRWTLG